MKLLEDIILKDSIEIKTSPERIFDFLVHLVDDKSYRAWHPDDHVALEWITGNPWEEGSIARAQEYLHGKVHTLKFRVTRVIPSRHIEYAPTSRLLRLYFPRNAFAIEPQGAVCVFTATAHMRVGRLVKRFAGAKLESTLDAVKKHMREEGEHLKRILEA